MNSLDKAMELKRRTKSFAIRIVTSFVRCLTLQPHKLWENNFCALARPLPRTIGQSVVLVPRLSSLQEWVSWWKRQTNPSSGSNFWARQESFVKKEHKIC